MKQGLVTTLSLTRIRLPDVVSLSAASMPFSKGDAQKTDKPVLSLENGYCFLLENGCRILLERGGTKAFPSKAPNPSAIRQENTGEG